MKRFIDLTFSLFLTTLFLPIILLIVILIKITSKGPAIFKQQRVGKDKKLFNIYKFRTMYVDAPKDVPTHLLGEPKRFITPIGRFLRKSSLDELPQLFNIIAANMSLVGPRPALFNQYDLLELRDRNNVNSIRPGLTGWAQVNGRDELLIEVKAEYDRHYFENMSLWFDLKICIMTISKVISAKGVSGFDEGSE